MSIRGICGIRGIRDSAGFSLPEILVSLLIMGFSLSGLLGFLRWGQMTYVHLTEAWQSRLFFNDMRRSLRHILTARDLDLVAGGLRLSPDLLPVSKVVKTIEVRVRPSSRETFFAVGRFFEDLNRNGRQDAHEPELSRTWVFRRRSGV